MFVFQRFGLCLPAGVHPAKSAGVVGKEAVSCMPLTYVHLSSLIRPSYTRAIADAAVCAVIFRVVMDSRPTALRSPPDDA